MKTYKTWEAIKMLSENPKLKFKRESNSNSDGDGLILEVNAYDRQYIEWEKGRRHLSLEDEWTLVQQSVTFMEAVKAWCEGEMIYCELNGKVSFKTRQLSTYLKGDSAVSMGEILYGKWFVEVSND